MFNLFTQDSVPSQPGALIRSNAEEIGTNRKPAFDSEDDFDEEKDVSVHHPLLPSPSSGEQENPSLSSGANYSLLITRDKIENLSAFNSNLRNSMGFLQPLAPKNDRELQLLFSTTPRHKPRFSILYLLFLVLNVLEFIVFKRIFDAPKISWKCGGNFIFFSQWLGSLEIFYWALCLLDNLLYYRFHSSRKWIHSFRDVFFACVIFPLASFGWITFFLEKSQGNSTLDVIRYIFSCTAPSFLIWVELYIVYHQYWSRPYGHWVQAGITMFTGCLLVTCNIIIVKRNDYYPNGFKEILIQKPKVIVYGIAASVTFMLYFIGRYLNRRIHVRKIAGENEVFEVEV